MQINQNQIIGAKIKDFKNKNKYGLKDILKLLHSYCNFNAHLL